MRKLIVSLPANRDFEGVLRLEDENGRVVAGPFAVCGRADDSAARRHGNSSRHTHLPFGDTPLGRYRMTAILPTGKGTSLSADRFGPNGVIVLAPTAGDAALADANGRFYIIIQGGKLSPGRRLRPTNGSLRLADKDQKRLVRALRRNLQCVCECVSTSESLTERVVGKAAPREESDPPLASSGINLAQLVATSGRFQYDREEQRNFDPPKFRLFVDSGGSSGGGDGGYKGDGADGTSRTPASEQPDPERDKHISDAADEAFKNAQDDPKVPKGTKPPCAKRVEQFIQAGGIPIKPIGGGGSAKDMGPRLVEQGFTQDGRKSPPPPYKDGDVAVIAACPPKHPDGHAAIWSAKHNQWISYYKQGGFAQPKLPYPAKEYRDAKTPFVIYHWPPSKKK
jgi:hypothetical protein